MTYPNYNRNYSYNSPPQPLEEYNKLYQLKAGVVQFLQSMSTASGENLVKIRAMLKDDLTEIKTQDELDLIDALIKYIDTKTVQHPLPFTQVKDDKEKKGQLGLYKPHTFYVTDGIPHGTLMLTSVMPTKHKLYATCDAKGKLYFIDYGRLVLSTDDPEHINVPLSEYVADHFEGEKILVQLEGAGYKYTAKLFTTKTTNRQGKPKFKTAKA